MARQVTGVFARRRGEGLPGSHTLFILAYAGGVLVEEQRVTHGKGEGS